MAKAPSVYCDLGDGKLRTYVMSEGPCTSVTRSGDVVILSRKEVEGRRGKVKNLLASNPDHPKAEQWSKNLKIWNELLEE